MKFNFIIHFLFQEKIRFLEMYKNKSFLFIVSNRNFYIIFNYNYFYIIFLYIYQFNDNLSS